MGVVRHAARTPSRTWIPALAERLTARARPTRPATSRPRSPTPPACSTPASPPRARSSSRTSARPGLEIGVLASALAATYDANLATSAGGADLVEQQALEWVAQFIGYPVAEGAFTSGGMTSNLTALLAAREHAIPGARVERPRRHAGRGVLQRRGAPLGHPRRRDRRPGQQRRAPRARSTTQRRMRPDELERLLEADLAAGVTPVAVVATAGTTLTGAVDPLDAIADVCERHGVWLHVDGAYGLPAAATATAAPLFAGLDRADSATLDAHKWLGVQKSCSVVMLRETGHLRDAFGHEERYMLHEGDVANPVDRTLEYSRPLNSLRLWMAFRVHGADQYRAWIERTLANARHLTDCVREHDAFELLHEPALSTVCFRHVPPGLSDEDLDRHNVRLARDMQTDGRIFIAPAVVDGRACLRACFVNFRTSPDAVPLVLEVAEELGQSAVRHGLP